MTQQNNSCKKPRVIAVGGPTASGKSALALELALRLGGEIISCDSMQIYRGMDIGTAKPTPYELSLVRHHMIDVCDPRDNYSAADFAVGAAEAIRDIVSRGKTPVICGGTGMYLDALLRPTSFSSADGNDTSDGVRAELKRFAEDHGADALHKRLREIDPHSAYEIHPNNVKRVIRALEIYYVTGITKTESDKQTTAGDSPYDCTVVTLDYKDRSILYERINRRVDMMIEAGLEDEVRRLYSNAILREGTTAAQAIGYKELLSYVNGEASLDSALELLKKNTRNYAKRQITWFKRYCGISVVPDEGKVLKSAKQLCQEVLDRLQ